MLDSNYKIAEKIAETPQAVVYKAYYRRNMKLALVLIILKAIGLSEYKQALLTQKFEQLKVLNDPLLILPLSIGVADGFPYLVHELLTDAIPELEILIRPQPAVKPLSPYLFLLSAYRHNEIDAGHPLSRLIQKPDKTTGH